MADSSWADCGSFTNWRYRPRAEVGTSRKPSLKSGAADTPPSLGSPGELPAQILLVIVALRLEIPQQPRHNIPARPRASSFGRPLQWTTGRPREFVQDSLSAPSCAHPCPVRRAY